VRDHLGQHAGQIDLERRDGRRRGNRRRPRRGSDGRLARRGRRRNRRRGLGPGRPAKSIPQSDGENRRQQQPRRQQRRQVHQTVSFRGRLGGLREFRELGREVQPFRQHFGEGFRRGFRRHLDLPFRDGLVGQLRQDGGLVGLRRRGALRQAFEDGFVPLVGERNADARLARGAAGFPPGQVKRHFQVAPARAAGEADLAGHGVSGHRGEPAVLVGAGEPLGGQDDVLLGLGRGHGHLMPATRAGDFLPRLGVGDVEGSPALSAPEAH